MKAQKSYRFAAMVVTILLIWVYTAQTGGASAPIPDDDNNRGYLHAENSGQTAGKLWVNIDAEDEDSVTESHKTDEGSGNNKGYGFPVREGPTNDSNLDKTIYFTQTNANVKGQVHLEFERGEPSQVRFKLSEDEDNELGLQEMDYESDGIYEFSFSIPDESKARRNHDLMFWVLWDQDTGSYEWTLYLDDTTYVDLPIAADNDDDGEPDYRDDDDDNDGVSDEDEEAAGTDPKDPHDKPEDSGTDGGDDDANTPGFSFIGLVLAITLLAILQRRR